MTSDATRPSLRSIGNYEIISKVAEGGMGTVYKGRHTSTGQIVAVKIINPSAAKNETLLRRFEREFSAARNLDHPHMVKGIEFCAAGASPYFVMEFVDGESVGQRIDRSGRIDEADAVRVISQVCEALHRAHQLNLVHRDVKPDNILLTREGTAKLTDLGLVKGLGDEDMNLTRTGRGLGTPHFMAPEQFRDAKNAGIRCDVYSAGATLYVMVTGKTPFSGTGPLDCWMKKIRNDFTPPVELVPGLSDRVNWAIMRAMSADPDKRPATCMEFIEDLKGQRGRPTPAGVDIPQQDVWYLVYRDEENQPHTVKGSTDGIRRALKDGLLGDAGNIVACRQKQGPFLSLKSHPEFRDLVVAPAPMPGGAPAGPSSRTPTPKAGRIDIAGPLPPGTPGTSSRSNRIPRTADQATAGPASGRIPHIPIDLTDRDPIGWLMWLLVAFLAVSAGIAFYVNFFR